jgi:hypothetical protein
MKTIKVSNETYELIKDQLEEEEKIDISSIDELVGKKLFLRTVTYHILGKVVKLIGDIIQLSDASWIADSGRFMNAIKDGELDEVEPVGDWFVNINGVTDFGIWKHDLPSEQK